MLLSFLAVFAVTATAAKSCPDWKLPWGTYEGEVNANNICVYTNIRFASPPVKDLRFNAPEYPPSSNPSSPGPNPSCIQTKEIKCVSGSPFEDAQSCYPANYGTQSEDCLFLDVYIPQKISTTPLPVVVWFYGGAYLFGSKSQYDPTKLPFYDGTGIVDTATQYNGKQDSVIYVRGNYRLGAFGWLAGSYMEQHGQPNAGLLDQRAILQFVQDHIADVQGNPNAVSVWGESAGASSIMHHLVMPQNIKKPLFQRAILQSPAYQWLWDRKGDLNNTFTDFATKVAKAAGCTQADMNCLRSASSDVVVEINQDLFRKEACEGIMPVGPSVDGNLIPTIAANSFANNQVLPLNVIAVSHVDLEVPYSNDTSGTSFIPLPIRQNPHSESAFQAFLDEVFTGPAYTTLRTAITARYPISLFSDQIARAAAIITDSSFTCNTRYIIDSYISTKTPVYAMDYAIFSSHNASTHASDLLPTFSSPAVDYKPFLSCISNATGIKLWALDHIIQGDTAKGLQEYFSSHAIFGDPNYNVGVFEHHWLKAYVDTCPDGSPAPGSCVWNLMKPVEAFVGSIWADNKGADEKTSSGICDFWRKAALFTEQTSNGEDGGSALLGATDGRGVVAQKTLSEAEL